MTHNDSPGASQTEDAWNSLSEATQRDLAHASYVEAVEMLAEQAKLFAEGIETGKLPDHGGAEALRVLAKLVVIQARSWLAKG